MCSSNRIHHAVLRLNMSLAPYMISCDPVEAHWKAVIKVLSTWEALKTNSWYMEELMCKVVTQEAHYSNQPRLIAVKKMYSLNGRDRKLEWFQAKCDRWSYKNGLVAWDVDCKTNVLSMLNSHPGETGRTPKRERVSPLTFRQWCTQDNITSKWWY